MKTFNKILLLFITVHNSFVRMTIDRCFLSPDKHQSILNLLVTRTRNYIFSFARVFCYV